MVKTPKKKEIEKISEDDFEFDGEFLEDSDDDQ